MAAADRIAGAEVVLADPELERDGRSLSRLVSRAGVTFLHASPGTWQTLVDSGLRPARALRGLSGGAPLGPELADASCAAARSSGTPTGPPERRRTCWRAASSAAGP